MTDKPLFTEKPGFRITQLYAFITESDNGDEGIIAFFNPTLLQMVPMIGADMTRVTALEEMARKVKAQTGQKIKLVYFSHRQEVREI